MASRRRLLEDSEEEELAESGPVLSQPSNRIGADVAEEEDPAVEGTFAADGTASGLDDDVSLLESSLSVAPTAVTSATTVAVVPAMVNMPIVGASKPAKTMLKGRIKVPKSLKFKKKQQELIDTANERIDEHAAALETQRSYSETLLKESKTGIDSLYKATGTLHKKLQKSMVDGAKQSQALSELAAEHKTTKSQLAEEKKKTKTLERAVTKLKGEKDKAIAALQALKSRAGKSKQQANKSPGTIAHEKSMLHVEEFRAKNEVKQAMKERDRQHDASIRRERMSAVGNMFSVDNGGSFVSLFDVCSTILMIALTSSNSVFVIPEEEAKAWAS